jgi:arylsulfatase A-like enzyme
LRALRDGRFKLIDAPRPELYDLDRDPFEERNLYDERPATAAAMTRRLQVLARSPSATGRESPTALPSHVTATEPGRVAAGTVVPCPVQSR